MIEFLGDAIAVVLREGAEVGAFGEIAPDQSVGILDGAALPGAVGPREIAAQAELGFELVIAGHLAAIVHRQRPDPMGPQQMEGPLREGGRGTRRQLADDHVARHPLDGRHEAGAGRAHHRIDLPVSHLDPGRDDRRPLVDRAPPRAPTHPTVEVPTALLPPLREPAIPRAARRLVATQILIDCLVADPAGARGILQLPDLLGRPAALEMPMHHRPLPRGDPPVAAGVAPPGHRLTVRMVPFVPVPRTPIASPLTPDRTAVPAQATGDRGVGQAGTLAIRDVTAFMLGELVVGLHGSLLSLGGDLKATDTASSPFLIVALSI